jgi:hypothetical protein
MSSSLFSSFVFLFNVGVEEDDFFDLGVFGCVVFDDAFGAAFSFGSD